MRQVDLKIKSGIYEGKRAIAFHIVKGNFLCVVEDTKEIVSVPITGVEVNNFLDQNGKGADVDLQNVIVHFEEKNKTCIASVIQANERFNDIQLRINSFIDETKKHFISIEERLNNITSVYKVHTDGHEISEKSIKDEIELNNKSIDAFLEKLNQIDNVTLEDFKMQLLECSSRLDNHTDSIDRNHNMFKGLSKESKEVDGRLFNHYRYIANNKYRLKALIAFLKVDEDEFEKTIKLPEPGKEEKDDKKSKKKTKKDNSKVIN